MTEETDNSKNKWQQNKQHQQQKERNRKLEIILAMVTVNFSDLLSSDEELELLDNNENLRQNTINIINHIENDNNSITNSSIDDGNFFILPIQMLMCIFQPAKQYLWIQTKEEVHTIKKYCRFRSL